jgi:hypothetical protein
MLRSAISATLGLILVAATGCSGTYVNIPHQAGDLASQDPNSARVRDLLTKATKDVIRTHNLPSPVQLNMPEATSNETHAVVASNIGGVIAPGAQTQPEPATTINVIAIRIRGTEGEVDFRAPTRAGSDVKTLITAYADWAMFSNWTIQRTKVWPGVAEGYE